jgi:hypothetical protein
MTLTMRPIVREDGHDDVANAVAGCAIALRQPFYDPFMGCGDDDDPLTWEEGDSPEHPLGA